MGKIREVGVPEKATTDWLKSLGLRSSNDPSLIPALHQIGFVDGGKKPTQLWRDYRGANYKAVLAQAIRKGYPNLYKTYPNAHDQANADLAHIFSAESTAGKQTVDRMVTTFKALAALADFGTATSQSTTPTADVAAEATEVLPGVPVNGATRSAGSMVVNVNIQLTLPETTDAKVFDAFFKSMKKHLLSEDDS
jgi:hypothetical protein